MISDASLYQPVHARRTRFRRPMQAKTKTTFLEWHDFVIRFISLLAWQPTVKAVCHLSAEIAGIFKNWWREEEPMGRKWGTRAGKVFTLWLPSLKHTTIAC
ncbi:hypothetical protein DKX38_021129 [Salix brachista]|uniref:Uncharacterized protein n=1 Tax=Salix brachista TaxID=2182728 RepID=A0A5N5K7P5_9ROSI|nr:hypothetical protein DKX38_021129 [Salix brachista]